MRGRAPTSENARGRASRLTKGLDPSATPRRRTRRKSKAQVAEGSCVARYSTWYYKWFYKLYVTNFDKFSGNRAVTGSRGAVAS
ncbi:hypothetical protein N9D08_00900 [bacterium]|nr:hypothetical protein [bacterium]